MAMEKPTTISFPLVEFFFDGILFRSSFDLNFRKSIFVFISADPHPRSSRNPGLYLLNRWLDQIRLDLKKSNN